LFSTNYNKTHKFRLKCENKYIIYGKNWTKIIKPKKPKIWTFENFGFFFKNLKNLGFFEAIFQPCLELFNGEDFVILLASF